MANHVVTLRSQRTIGLSAAGDPLARRLVLLCHPTPGAGQFDPDPVITSRWGVHVVMLDRPGYGATPPHSDAEPHTIQHRADELAEFVEQSENTARAAGAPTFGPIGVVGWGTGGMVALSLAARHPDLVDRVATVNTVAPNRAGVLPATEMSAPYTWSSLSISDDDPALDLPGLGNRIDRMLREAGLQSNAGVENDRQMLADDHWVGELGRVTAEVRLIYGDDDAHARIDDGHWYRGRIPLSRTVRVPDQGALTIAARWARILEHVAPHHGGLI